MSMLQRPIVTRVWATLALWTFALLSTTSLWTLCAAPTQLWVREYAGPAGGNDVAEAVAIDRLGNIVDTGSSSGAGGSDDYLTAKYAGTNGALRWERRYNGPANRYDQAVAVAVDQNGNAAVTGWSNNGTNDDIYTAKYAASNGAVIWEVRYDGPGKYFDTGKSVAFDGM